jgi:hypothetical protein
LRTLACPYVPEFSTVPAAFGPFRGIRLAYSFLGELPVKSAGSIGTKGHFERWTHCGGLGELLRPIAGVADLHDCGSEAIRSMNCYASKVWEFEDRSTGVISAFEC